MLYCAPITNYRHQFTKHYIDEVLEIFHSMVDVKSRDFIRPLDFYISRQHPRVALAFMVISAICSEPEISFINDYVRGMTRTPIAFRDYCDSNNEATTEEIQSYIMDVSLRNKIFSATVNLFDKE